ncbi:vanillate/3-O-methylgallate O-demethylase [Ostreiculturibacter nitratireducens]|uniref:vanillate/3-O-methylgallate O-demethylase n=1 Tax=Ostreiculturibacter nitratireducens TaxID=3075226 RepID=UPI0031B56A3F
MAKSLEDLLKERGDTVGMLRNSQIGMYVYPVVANEFTNWRDEQKAWRDSAVLFDQSHHMAEIMVEGPDAGAFLEHLGINSFAKFPVGKAKHFVPVTPDGYVIGDVIMFHEEENRYNLVGRAPTINWVDYNAQKGGFSVKATRDERSPMRPDGKAVTRRHYRFQIQGPNADHILTELNGGPLPDIKFFNMDWINIAGRKVRALRHGMAGAPGLEIWGPYADKDEIQNAIIEVGRKHGLHQVGSRAYSTNTLESGWIPSPLPAIYTGDGLADYRRWLPANGYEATGSIGGSFVSGNIEDYYSTPYELGYGFYIGFDHDFIGREALEKMKDRPHRRKVTFEWNAEDVMKVISSAFQRDEDPFKWIDFPQPNYASASFDKVMMGDKVVGLSMFNGYSFNERCLLSLGVVDPEIKEGDVLTLVWGEENGGTGKTSTERHRQTTIRVKVSPTPYAREARENYVESWRTRSH